MRCLALLCPTLLISFAWCEDAKLLPPGITKEDAAAGWIALFDGESLYGWKSEGNAKVEGGVLVFGGNTTASIETTTAFSAFEFEMSYRVEGNNGGFTFKYGDGVVGKKLNSSNPDKKFEKQKISTPGSSKKGPIRITTDEGTILFIESIKLKPLGLQPIFNGKNLDGWKEIPDHKSKFSVTEQGELNVRDGNGDLQTEKQWDDFVLQLDVISLGDHLNSGVFFRCLPGQFWSGYEAQVRNEWQSTVTTKSGESATGSLTENGNELEVKQGRNNRKFQRDEVAQIVHQRNRPIDFGTGGIYHFRPARRVVSTDREFFTMTVIAHGNHFAVWVNGYQTAEFTDQRPQNENARRGRKDGKGAISLQGHDPTTNLSFKNINLAELPK